MGVPVPACWKLGGKQALLSDRRDFNNELWNVSLHGNTIAILIHRAACATFNSIPVPSVVSW